MNLRANLDMTAVNPATLYIRTIKNVEVTTLPPLVLLHGWGCDSEVWGDFIEALGETFPQRDLLLVDLPGFGQSDALFNTSAAEVLLRLEQSLPERMVLIGWSLGGMLASVFAYQWPDRIEALICLATNASYRQRKDWTQAVPRADFQSFEQLLQENPAQCLKQFRANQVLGDHQGKTLLRQLTHLSPDQAGHGWGAMLALLDAMDNREQLVKLKVDTLYLFGEQDRMVPAAVANGLKQLNPNIQSEILPGAGHVLHLSQPQQVAITIQNWLEASRRKSQWQREKKRVADSFSRSATSYDSVAHLQREVGQQLLEMVEPRLACLDENACFLDLGSGTGYFAGEVATRHPQLKCLGLDFAKGMVEFARTRYPQCMWCCGDAELLPLAENSVDALYSNMTVQWCEDLPGLAKEIYRVLKPGAVAVLSTLTTGTLHELSCAWQQVDEEVHVNRFQSAGFWKQVFSDQSFAEVSLVSEVRITHYRNALELAKELKALGAHNVNDGRNKKLTGKQRLRAFADAYEPFREAESSLLPATWQVAYLELHKVGA